MDSTVITRLGSIVDKLKNMPDSFWFAEPVNWKEMKLDDYPEIVKNPMDLATLSSNLKKKKKYATPEQFCSDLDLIWSNCQLYNGPTTEVHSVSQAFQKASEELKSQFYADLEAIKNGGSLADEAAKKKVKRRSDQLESEGLITEQGAFREKARLCRRMAKLRPEPLGAIIRAVRAEFPDTVAVVANDRLTINVDLFSQAALLQVNNLVKQKLKEQTKVKQIVQAEENKTEETKTEPPVNV